MKTPQRHLIDGTVRLFLAESLVFPTGLITAAVLARHLNPSGYGQFTLAALLISWIEWMLPALFSRTAVKLVGESDDWRPIGAAMVRLYLIAGLACAIAVWALAGTISRLMNEPALASSLKLFAVDIPIFACTYGHRNILVGIGEYRRQSVVSCARWIARFFLIILFVEMGFSVTGAIAGSIGASLAEFVAVRWWIRPSFFGRHPVPIKGLFALVVPLFLAAVCTRLFDRSDLFFLKALGASAAQAGYYGAAQNLALAPNLVALSLGPLLLSTLTRMLRTGDLQGAREIGKNVMRFVLCLAPFAAAAAGSSSELTTAIFGQQFLAASPMIGPLVGAALALVMVSVGIAIVTAAGKPKWVLPIALPLPLIAIPGDLIAIPRWGSVGAANVTLGAAAVAAVIAISQVHRIWRIHPGMSTLLRSFCIGLLTRVVSAKWIIPLPFLPVKLVALTVLIIAAFILSGEFDPASLFQINRFRNRRKIELDLPRSSGTVSEK